MTKTAKTEAPAEPASEPLTPAQAAHVEPVVLVLAAEKRDKDGRQTDVILARGMQVAAYVRGSTTAAVTFDGDKNAFINELSALVGPTRVMVRERPVERMVEVDGQQVPTMVPELTASLADG